MELFALRWATAMVARVVLASQRCHAGLRQRLETWWLGSRTQWNVTKDFYMGFDVLYAKLDSASTSNGLNTRQITSASGVTNVADIDNWQFRFRVHRDFYP